MTQDQGEGFCCKSSRGFQARESIVSDLPLRRIPLTAVRKVVWGGETERGVVGSEYE